MNPQINEHGAFYIWIAQEIGSLETVFIGGNVAKVTKVKTETLKVWD